MQLLLNYTSVYPSLSSSLPPSLPSPSLLANLVLVLNGTAAPPHSAPWNSGHGGRNWETGKEEVGWQQRTLPPSHPCSSSSGDGSSSCGSGTSGGAVGERAPWCQHQC